MVRGHLPSPKRITANGQSWPCSSAYSLDFKYSSNGLGMMLTPSIACYSVNGTSQRRLLFQERETYFKKPSKCGKGDPLFPPVQSRNPTHGWFSYLNDPI